MSELTQTQADFEGPGLVKPFHFLISRRHDELRKDPSSLNMSSSGLSHKNLLVPLLVSKQSVSPGPSVSLCSYLVYLNLLLLSIFCLLCCSLIYLLHLSLYTLPISLFFACLPYFPSVCFYAICVSCSLLCVNFI